MGDLLLRLFSETGFMPHGHCFLWTPGLLWAYVVSDATIAVAYYSIPIALWHFTRKRQDLPFRWIFLMFAFFVLACGTTHVMAIWNIWQPEYWLDADIKIITALASIATAILLVPLIPKALALPSPRMLADANQALQQEVSQHKTTEVQLRERTHSLEALNRELESFSYSASHDLRAPLRSMEGYAKLLLKRCSGKLNGEEQDYLDRIAKASQQMTRLIDDLLRLSKLSRHDLQTSSVDISALARELFHELKESTPQRQVKLIITPHLGVYADPALTRLMLSNLLSNAWKFTANCSDAVIEIGLHDTPEGHVFYIRDNGVGFNPTYKEKLFTPFARLHRQDEFEGTGVGLTIVERIIERHGGKIWAESTEGHGATFYFTLGLPLAEPAILRSA